MDPNKRREPLDLAALLRKKSEAAAAWKPKFIPKKEREALAAEKEAAEKKKQEKEHAHKPSQALPKNIPTGPKAMREEVPRATNGNYVNNRKRGREDEEEEARRKMEADDEAALREKYYGPPVNQVSKFSAAKKKRRDASTKFHFDWDPSDDTSRPHDDRYANRLQTIHSSRLPEMSAQDIQTEAEAIRRADPIYGQTRAQKLLDDWQRAKQVADKKTKTLGKHWSEKPLEEMTQRDWRIFKENFGIATKGGSIPNPIRNWNESNLPKQFLDIIASVGYDEPTPIQRAAIPIALQSRDLIGVAATGSGKTAAFLLPLLVYISKLEPLSEFNKNDGPYALILAPTRELAQQIEAEARKFATPLGFNVVSIVGGHAHGEQMTALEKGAEIIVATPGRLVEYIESRFLVFSQCCYVIMDEADRMIDQGFEEPLTKILDAMPVSNEKPDTDEAENPLLMGQYLGRNRYRQTMMYSATMPPLVEKIANKYLRRPARITVGNAGEAVDTVEQRVEFIPGEDKRKRRLQEILNSGAFKPPIIVFVNIKRNCDAVAKDIKSMGHSAVTLHGSKTQEQREAALASLRNGQTEILVATDLAGRGIDVPDVSLVVNFNMATSIESYTHRIGRTGRAGKSGVAITFLGSEDSDVLYDLKQIISKSTISKVPEELRRHEAAQSKTSRGMKKIE